MDNPGRYLTLLPPINSAAAYTGTPYFTQNPGDPFKAWGVSITYDYMPRQWITFRAEYGYRHANVPYFTGRGRDHAARWKHWRAGRVRWSEQRRRRTRARNDFRGGAILVAYPGFYLRSWRCGLLPRPAQG